jgi:hypothetical protein
VTANYMMNGDQPQCAARTVLILASREEEPMRESQGLGSRQPRSIEIRTGLREDYSDVYTAAALAAIEALAILDDDRKKVIALRTERRMSRYRDHQRIAFLDAETGIRAGDTFTIELYERLHREEMEKLLRAGNRDVYADSKVTTLPIVSAIIESDVKTPWYIDLLNVNIDNVDLAAAEERIQMYMRAFQNDGTRITENLDFA